MINIPPRMVSSTKLKELKLLCLRVPFRENPNLLRIDSYNQEGAKVFSVHLEIKLQKEESYEKNRRDKRMDRDCEYFNEDAYLLKFTLSRK